MGLSCSKRPSARTIKAQHLVPKGLLAAKCRAQAVDLQWLANQVESRKLAPFWSGGLADEDSEETCSICWTGYPSVNWTSGCGKPMCSTCYVSQLVVQPSWSCPFCRRDYNCDVRVRPCYTLFSCADTLWCG